MSKKQSPTIAMLTLEMEAGISDVISGKRKDFSASNITPAMVERFLEPMGWQKGEFDTNGWQYDWWLPFTKGGVKFIACGGGYYGNFEFGPDED